MMGALPLTVLNPERVLLSVESVAKVRLRLSDGAWLSIYPNHAPLIAETLGGALQYDTEFESGEIEVAPGILHVASDGISVLTSGMMREDVPVGTPEGIEERRFERLAQQLMLTLSAHPESDADASTVGKS